MINNIRPGDKARITAHNVNNSEQMNEILKEKFPVGSICTVKEVKVPQRTGGISIKDKNKAKSFVTCDRYNLEFCKTVSLNKCITIENDKGDITHICYLSIEKI